MTPEYLIKMDLGKATARELLMLIAMAVDDVKKAEAGALKHLDGRKMVPNMTFWGYEKDYVDSSFCPACLAGCAVLSRFHKEEGTGLCDLFPSADFLDQCRWLPFRHPGFSLSRELLEERGIIIPSAGFDYCASVTADVVRYLENLLSLNSSLLVGVEVISKDSMVVGQSVKI
jgi:hypothetical protein